MSRGLYSNLLLTAGLPVSSDQVAQGCVQSVLKISKDRDCTALLGSLIQCLTVFMENCLLISSWNLWIQFLTLVSHVPTMYCCKTPGTVFWLTTP